MPKSLAEVFRHVFDPRSRHGWIRDLVSTLSPAVVAILAGIARFGRDHKAPLAHALGFRRGTTPSPATFSRLLRRIEVEAVEAVEASGSSGGAPTSATTSPSTAKPSDAAATATPRPFTGSRRPRRRCRR